MVSNEKVDGSQRFVKFLKWDEAVRKIEETIRRLDCRWLKGYLKIDALYLPLLGLRRALEGQLELIKELNDEYFSCDVPWDIKTGLPSHPTLAADVKKYAELIKGQEKANLKAILNSFSAWALLLKSTVECSCGREWKLEKANDEIWLNHILAVQEEGLSIKQLIGVKSDNRRHLKHHFEDQEPSKADGDRIIIWKCENLVNFKEKELVKKSSILLCDKTFDSLLFRKVLAEA